MEDIRYLYINGNFDKTASNVEVIDNDVQRVLLGKSLQLDALVNIARYLHFGQAFERNQSLALDISKIVSLVPNDLRTNLFKYIYALQLSDNSDRKYEKTAVNFMMKLTELSYMPAIVRYGNYLEMGSMGLTKDVTLAEEYYLKAAKMGHVKGLGFLARINRNKSNWGAKIYGWTLTLKIILLSPFIALRMGKGYVERDFFG